METFSDDLDTSSYATDSGRNALGTLYSPRNAKVLGKFKDECNGTAPLEFVGLRSVFVVGVEEADETDD